MLTAYPSTTLYLSTKHKTCFKKRSTSSLLGPRSAFLSAMTAKRYTLKLRVFLLSDRPCFQVTHGHCAITIGSPGLICRAADRVLLPPGGATLESTCHYNGPEPATVTIQPNPLPREEQLDAATERLRQQIRVYADFIRQGDRIAVIVARTKDRKVVLDHLSEDPLLHNMVQIVRAREAEETDYDPALDATCPILILTAKGCKGLEFRTVHWLFADKLRSRHGPEDYYTVITRAKTSLDVYYTESLPEILARAHAEDGVVPW